MGKLFNKKKDGKLAGSDVEEPVVPEADETSTPDEERAPKAKKASAPKVKKASTPKAKKIKTSKLESIDLKVLSVSKEDDKFVIGLEGKVVVIPAEGKAGNYNGLSVGSNFDPSSKDI